MNIQKLRFSEHSLEESFKPLLNDLGNLLDEHEVYMHVGNVISWISQIDELHFKTNKEKYRNTKLENNVMGLISGIRYTFNLYKHEINFIKLNVAKNGITFPISFPLRFMHWEWDNIELFNTRNETQHKNYIDYLQGREIRSTLNKAIEFLLKEGDRYR